MAESSVPPLRPRVRSRVRRAAPDVPAWPFGDAEMAARVRAFDWSRTALGSVEGWDAAWRGVVDLMLGSPVPMSLQWGRDGLLLYNEAYASFAGARHPQVFGMPICDAWPEVAEFSRRTLDACLRGESVVLRDQQAELDRGAGLETLWINLDYSPVRGSDGSPIGALTVIGETTERVRTEMRQRALVELGDRLRTLTDSGAIVEAAARLLGETLRTARSGYAVIDASERVATIERDWTDARLPSIAGAHVLEDYGPPLIAALKRGEAALAEDVATSPFTAGVAPGFDAIAVRAFMNLPLVQDGRLTAIVYVHDAEPRRWASEELALLRDVADRTWEAMERVTAEAELRALNQTLERRVADAIADRQLWADIWEATADPVAAVDFDVRVIACNSAYREEFARLFGRAIAVGDRIPDKLAHLPGVREQSMGAWRVALSGKVIEASGIGEGREDGKFYDIKFQPLRRDGVQIGAFQYSREVSARVRAEAQLKDAEEQLRQAQKMEAVGQLTGGIAHDFNNLLQGILGSLNLVQKRLAAGRVAEVDRFITGAVTSANRAAALTHRLLAFSRRQPLDPKPVRANQLVASMEDLLRRTLGEQVELELVLAGGLWPTLCDPNQLESAILNLAINARDAMPGGGKLTIETCNAHLDDRYAAKSRDITPGQYVCVCVTDTGTGMSAEVIERAFDPFFTTKPIGQGTGLGLSMIYGFARQSEGYAKIYSEVGQGTTVKLYLPRLRGEGGEADEAPEPQLTEAHQAEAGETVLVVEDEPVVRGLIVEVLHELGYRALEAADGPAGLELLRNKRRRIDLLVTDIGLPGLNGRQLADAARELRPDLRVLFMTGYAENAALANGFLDAGMAMITKPFAMEHLATRIREMVKA